MDRSRYRVRPFAEGDYEAAARISTAIEPRTPESADQLRHWDLALAKEPDRFTLKIAVEEIASSDVVAWGAMSHTMFNYHPHKYGVRLDVTPAHQGRGIGQECYAMFENEARARSAVCLWSGARAHDVRSVRFQERQGFVPQRRTWVSRLALADLDLSKFPDRSNALQEQGIRITTLAAEGAHQSEVLHRLYALSRITARDVPRMGDYTPVAFEAFVEIDVGGIRSIPEACFLACQRDEYVGWSSLERELGSTDTVGVGFTGTHPEYRGRGIASELKRRAIEYAKTQGYRFLITGNDSRNQKIVAINEKFGFRPEITWIGAEKVLAPPSAGPSGDSLRVP
jgi:mycothiol synthase